MSTTSQARPEPNASIIELIYAGNALANRLMSSIGAFAFCVCGIHTLDVTNPANHADHCPLARYYVAVESVRSAVL